tara:strand:+ start:7473 stop:7946 length:474 start_codon:yes stop_codon:yes gene_type:complete
MKFTTKEDIEAPLAYVYGALSDFEYWERAAMRRGADIERTDSLRTPGAGMGWKVAFDYHGKPRDLEVELLMLEHGQRITFDATGNPAGAGLDIELVEMGPKRTRVSVEVDIKPKSLAARVFLQSLRLAKAKVQRKYEVRIAQVAAEIEDRYRAQMKS